MKKLLGLLLLAALAACSRDSDQAGKAQTQSPNALETCSREVMSGVELMASGEAGTLALIRAIGQESVQFRMALELQSPLNQLIQQRGVHDAMQALAMKVIVSCSTAGTPVLTRGQLEGLKAIVSPDNAADLATITLVADTVQTPTLLPRPSYSPAPFEGPTGGSDAFRNPPELSAGCEAILIHFATDLARDPQDSIDWLAENVYGGSSGAGEPVLDAMGHATETDSSRQFLVRNPRAAAAQACQVGTD